MTLLHRILAALIVLAAVAVALQFLRLKEIRQTSEAAEASLHEVRRQIATIQSLTARSPDWTRRTQVPLGQGGLATAVNDCLASAGLPQSTLASLSPSTDSPLALGPPGPGNAGLHLVANRRRAVMTLAPITLPQTGKLLSAWRESHPDLVVTSIEISPEPLGRREPEPGSNLPLRAVITIETLFVQTSSTAGVRR